jgi:hypothetical protein
VSAEHSSELAMLAQSSSDKVQYPVLQPVVTRPGDESYVAAAGAELQLNIARQAKLFVDRSGFESTAYQFQ